ncbi:MAG: hypothetical protein WCI56_00300 [Hyphomicrobiales bacterium]
MQPDARIEDILPTLSDPEEYVRGIVGSFISEGFSDDEAVIRIGVSGTGVAPHYCIEQGSTTSTIPNIGKIKAYEHRAIFHGKSHRPILEDDSKGISWSSAAMSFAEVQAILGRLRASKRTH